MNNVKKSALFLTSAASDVRRSGGILRIAGLFDVEEKFITSVVQKKYKAEVVQIGSVGATTYTPEAEVLYTALIGDPLRSRESYMDVLKPYSYKTPADLLTLGATPALQREAIHAKIIAKINLDNTNFVTAASLLLGTGISITDGAGYYPARAQGQSARMGATMIKTAKNDDGTGWDNNFAITTEAVYGWGVGARLLADVPVIDGMNGNLISGYLKAPKTAAGASAVSGQNYDSFHITSFKEVAAHSVTGQLALEIEEQVVFVDNGTGSSTTNLTGFTAFERQIWKLMVDLYKNDPSTVAEFFDKNFVIQGPLGAVPVTTAGIINKFLTPYGMLNHINIGTQTIVSPAQTATGLAIEQDVNAADGAAYTPDLSTLCDQQFVVGKQEICLLVREIATTVANEQFITGLRKKEAHQADFNDYNDLVGVGINSAGDLYTWGILANAATVATDTTVNAADATAVMFRVTVDIAGVVAVYINDVKYPVYSAGTTPLVFAAGTILVPFFQFKNLNSAAAVPVMSRFIAVADKNVVQ